MNSNVYTFNFWINGVPGSRNDTLLAWEFAASNLAGPGVWSSANKNWSWDSKKGVLKIDPNTRYIYGAALAPGDTLTFLYTLGNGVTPSAGHPTFVAHVASAYMDGRSGDRWIDQSNTWFDNSLEVTKPQIVQPVPEPSGLIAISSAIFSLGCLMIKRARV